MRSPITDGQGFQLLATDTAVMADLQRRYPHVSWTKDRFAAVVELIFKRTIDKASFIYIVAPSDVPSPDGSIYPKGYVGTMAAGEMGHAVAAKIPMYSSEPLDPSLDEEEGITWPVSWRAIAEQIKPYKPHEIVAMVNKGKLDSKDYFWCEGGKRKSRWFKD